ncbi:hypothetical protein N1851_014549 [Merluccius polli]|uniref:Transposable element P transposase-like GTP-binding insertion domain-containing protein n=1 Tax=Merluccius polli TaxID=89951 RepID=A0AA47MTT5_MERPO|nr:hypothetical protein N1851_014549 [Merluccius polli]
MRRQFIAPAKRMTLSEADHHSKMAAPNLVSATIGCSVRRGVMSHDSSDFVLTCAPCEKLLTSMSEVRKRKQDSREQAESTSTKIATTDLVSYQEGMALKLAPNLSRAILEPNHFEKMKVSSAMHIFSEWTSAALKYLVEEEQRPESNLTTSWFLEKMDHWFDLMSSRHVICNWRGLKRPTTYPESFSLLHIQLLKDCLPDSYDYHVCDYKTISETGDHVNFRATLWMALSTEDEIKLWLKSHTVTWRVDRTDPGKGQKVLFKVDFRCQHKKRPRGIEKVPGRS